MQIKKFTGRKTAVSLLGGLLYACMYAVGSEIDLNQTCLLKNVLIKLLYLFPLFSALLGALLYAAQKYIPAHTRCGRPVAAWKAFLIILISFIPCYILVYPGSFDYDTATQMKYIMRDAYGMHHPLLHTLFIRLCVSLISIVKSPQYCAVIYTGVQMVLLAWMFALAAASAARSFGSRAGWWCCACFSLYPMHAYLASNMTKDVLFSGAFVLMFALCVEAVVKQQWSCKLGIGILTAAVLAVLLRNNMIYALAAWLVFLLFLKKSRMKRRLFAVLLAALVLAAGINGGLQKALDAKPGNMREMLSMPAQQLARARLYRQDRFTRSEQERLDRLVQEQAYLNYVPSCADKVKSKIDSEALKADPKPFIQLYLSVGGKCTQEYVDAAAALVAPYLYPYPKYNIKKDFLEMQIIPEAFDKYFGEGSVKRLPALDGIREWMNANVWLRGADEIPVLRWIFNMGLISWIMLFFLARDLYCGQYSGFLVHCVVVLLWGTCLLGPVMLGRYIYPVVCVLPFLSFPVETEADTGRQV